jgi:hypothetical protein
MADATFYSTCLFQDYDFGRTSNNLDVGFLVIKDNYGIKPPKIQIKVSNFKNRTDSRINLSYQQIFNFVESSREIMKSVNSRKIFDVPISFKQLISNKIKLIIKTLQTSEYGRTVLIIVSTRGEDYLDSEKFFISFDSFKALFSIFNQVINNYVMSTSNFGISCGIDGLVDKTHNSLEKLDNIYRTNITNNNTIANVNNHPQAEELEVFDPGDIFDSDESAVVEYKVPESVEEQEEVNQDDLDTFIKDETEEMDIPDVIFDNDGRKEINQNVSKTLGDDFTKLVIDNNAMNLEALIHSLISKKIPLLVFIEHIKEKLKIKTLFTNTSGNDYNRILYSNTLYLKEILRRHLQQKNPIPNGVFPVRCKEQEYDETTRSLMYSLYTYSVCYSLIHLQLKEKSNISTENKELISFILKVLTAPFVYTFIKCDTRDEFINSIKMRAQLCLDGGIFDSCFEAIENKLHHKPTIAMKSVEEVAGKTYDAIIKRYDEIDSCAFINSLFKSKISLVDCESFDLCQFKNESDIETFIDLEFDYKKHDGKVDLENKIVDTSSFNTHAINVLGMKSETYDNTNIIRYVSKVAEKEDNITYLLEIVNKINKDVGDVDYENIEWNIFPEEILKAIHCWTPEADKKLATNYAYYKQRVSECSIDKENLQSMFRNYESLKEVDDYFGGMHV